MAFACLKTCPDVTLLNAFATGPYALNITLSNVAYLDGITLIMQSQDFWAQASLPSHPDYNKLKNWVPMTVWINHLNVTTEFGIFGLLATVDTNFGPLQPLFIGATTATQAQLNQIIDFVFQKETDDTRTKLKCCFGSCPAGVTPYDPVKCSATLTAADNYFRLASQVGGLGVIDGPVLITAKAMAKNPWIRVIVSVLTFPTNSSSLVARASDSHGWDFIIWLGSRMQYSPLTIPEVRLSKLVRGIATQILNGQYNLLNAKVYPDLFAYPSLTQFDGTYQTINQIGASLTDGPHDAGTANITSLPTNQFLDIFPFIQTLSLTDATYLYQYLFAIEDLVYPL